MNKPFAFPLVAAALAAVSIAASAQSPLRAAKAGDVHVYAGELRTDRARFEETVTVTAVEGGQIRTSHVRSDRPAPSEGLYGTDWGTIRSGSTGTQMDPPSKVLQLPLQVGNSWESSYQTTSPTGARSRVKMESTVAAREKVSTPGGEFDAFRIESRGYLSGLSWQGGFGILQKVWYAPAIDRVVRLEYREQRTLGADNVVELKQFRPAD